MEVSQMTGLKSNAELNADKSRQLQGFKKISLPDVRDKVAAILNMIGRVEGIFSTYTLHDISHIDAMLEMLDWLIPPATKKKLTHAEWLLIVLSIYLHDLGMVVTAEEYEKRKENPKFTDFVDSLETTSEGRDYLGRIAKMTDERKENFFYQEFVRMNHAARIREWILGRHSYQWGDSVKPIADEIAKLLENLPERFRKNLADVCESHHKDNLDDRNYYPLCSRYGNHPQGLANVQYAAIILRTADLLHITKDRTPSIMYKTLKITDPMGVDEWKKQMGTFSVHMKGREFDEEDTDSHVIEISADFSEERPFFVLSEYIEYARDQMEQSKRWVDASRQVKDAKYYSFPWHSVVPNIQVEGNEPIPIRFELDRGRLLNLLVGHTIYNDATVAVRELMQNAIDAVRFQHHLECEGKAKTDIEPEIGEVQVNWSKEKRELTVQDNGTGMDYDIIQYHLMKVGASYYDTAKFNAEYGDFTPISRFGIGILTCFMISDEIEIITYRKEGGYRIRMSSVQANYLLKKLEPGNPCLEGLEPHGTRVKLILRASIDIEKKTMLDILRHWVILPACKVWFKDEKGEPQRIGFDTPADALQYYYSDSLTVSDSRFTQELEILSSHHQEGKESYDLAFATMRGFSPERNFMSAKREKPKNQPAVCIEGIRVDDHLPGFNIDFKICALLLVKNNKKFRTTVSRSNIEQDEEYLKAGKICTTLLYKHLKGEVKRISESKGNPLSQASTASKWMNNNLMRSMGNSEIAKFLNDLYSKTPIVVIERVERKGEGVETTRELISVEKLKRLDSFWTIESRLENYLGVISRDLGRELSLNDFMSKMAPELQNPRINPVISDASQFSYAIMSSHIISEVEFSRIYRQLLIRWVLPASKQPMLKLNETERMGVDNFTKIDLSVIRSGYGFSIESVINSIMCNLPINGDLKTIKAVKSNFAIIISPDLPLSKIIEDLKGWAEKCSRENKERERVIIISLLLFIFASIVSDDDYKLKKWLGMWQIRINEINDTLANIGANLTLPDNLKEITGNRNIWFRPDDYWLNW
jgi:hypothetical protein